jgi:cold shock CspA family protein
VRNERFEDMEVGMEVVFVEEQGLRGPQASTVKLR